ncbi:hypothetical protein BJX66DRAFT_177639 [Aspergillus keveii]|uniref:Uncharacterized protein n=1 Tax=Aspergillus keveii TaxID=714993 RepID=A0ABR4G8K6_9EURO
MSPPRFSYAFRPLYCSSDFLPYRRKSKEMPSPEEIITQTITSCHYIGMTRYHNLECRLRIRAEWKMAETPLRYTGPPKALRLLPSPLLDRDTEQGGFVPSGVCQHYLHYQRGIGLVPLCQQFKDMHCRSAAVAEQSKGLDESSTGMVGTPLCRVPFRRFQISAPETQ